MTFGLLCIAMFYQSMKLGLERAVNDFEKRMREKHTNSPQPDISSCWPIATSKSSS